MTSFDRNPRAGTEAGTTDEIASAASRTSSNGSRRSLLGLTFDELDERTFRRYARELTGRELAPGTVQTYYARDSAYTGWCVREGLLEANYAQRNVAKEPLPENDGRRSGDQQAWTDERRALIARYVEERANDAADEKGFDAIREFRDRTLVYILCYSGVRGGEIVAHPTADRRTVSNGTTFRSRTGR